MTSETGIITDPSDSADPNTLRICLVVNCFNDASIEGCYFRALVDEYKDQEVTVVAISPASPPDPDSTSTRWMELPANEIDAEYRASKQQRHSLRLLNWLEEENFDLVIAFDLGGVLYYSLLASRQGHWKGDAAPGFVLAIIGPSRRLDEVNERHVSRRSQMIGFFMERQCLQMADEVRFATDDARDWVEQRENKARDTPTTPSGGLPTISVCMTHLDRPHWHAHAMEGLHNQTYRNFEVILFDDGSRSSEALAYLDKLEKEFADRNWTLIRGEGNIGPALARNKAAEVAKGEYLLFMDDDNIAKPDQLETFAKAVVHADLDIATCFVQVFDGSGGAPAREEETTWIWMPLGPSVAIGTLANCVGDTNFIVRRSVFQDMHGFAPDPPGHQIEEDYEFLARAAIEGRKIQVVPRMLYWYRRNDTGSRSKWGSLFDRETTGLAVYRSRFPPELDDLFAFAHGFVKEGDLDERVAKARRVNRKLSKLRHEASAYLRAAQDLEAETDRVFRSKRWRAANFLRTLSSWFSRKGDSNSIAPKSYQRSRDKLRKAANRLNSHLEE